MFDAEATAQDADAVCWQRARTGFSFLLSEYGQNWYQTLGEFAIYMGDNRNCALAHAAGKEFSLAVDDLRVKYGPDVVTDQWLYDHGFLDTAKLAPKDGSYRPGYIELTSRFRTLVNDAKFGILPTTG